MEPDVSVVKRIRGGIVDVLYTRHAQQQHRVDHVALWHILQDLGFDVGENDVVTQVQDLCDRGYVVYDQKRDRRTNYLTISMIQLTARGRDLREGTLKDAAVFF